MKGLLNVIQTIYIYFKFYFLNYFRKICLLIWISVKNLQPFPFIGDFWIIKFCFIAHFGNALQN